MAAPAHLLFMGLCACVCHSDDEGDRAAESQRDGFGWTRFRTADGRGLRAVHRAHGSTDAARHSETCAVCVAAASACGECRDHHAGALSGRPPELAPPTKTQALAAAVLALARDTTFTPPTQWSGDGDE
jgi:hypothetical protein